MPSFFAAVLKHFAPLMKEHGFAVSAEQYNPEGFGSGALRLSSARYLLEFTASGMGPALSMSAARHGQPQVDLNGVFSYLTRGLGGASGLYFAPHLALNIWGEDSIAWQAARLAEVLQPMWPGIFIFLDGEGPRTGEFSAFLRAAAQEAAAAAADGYRLPRHELAALEERSGLGFAEQAQKSFGFLRAYGFSCAQTGPLLVRYESAPAAVAAAARLPEAEEALPPRPAAYINIFQRVKSMRLGVQCGLVRHNPGAEMDFDLLELAAFQAGAAGSLALNAQAALGAGWPITAFSAAEMPAALNRLARAFRKFGAPILAGDLRLLDALLARRVDAARRASRAWADRNRGRVF